MNSFQAVSVTRLYRMIADQIAGRIRAGDFPPGSRLPSERDLAEQLQVSRPSVREALIALEIEGYVEVRVGAGVFVVHAREVQQASSAGVALVAGDIGPFELLETRLLVEPTCAALTATQATPQQVEAIARVHATPALTHAHDRAFHETVAAGCGNAALAATIAHLGLLSEQSALYARLETHFLTPHVWQTAHDEHTRILEAITRRDGTGARVAMESHLTGVLTRLREDFGSLETLSTAG